MKSKNAILFLLMIIIISSILFYIYKNVDVKLNLFKIDKQAKILDEQISKKEDKIQVKEQEKIDYLTAINYIFDFNPETKVITFGLKNTTDKKLTLNFNSGALYDIEIIGDNNDYYWRLSDNTVYTQSLMQLNLKPYEQVTYEIKLPENIENNLYIVRAYSLAEELVDKDTVIEKIQVIKNESGIVPVLDETSSFDIDNNIIYEIRFVEENNSITVLLGNISDKSRTLNFDKSLYVLEIYDENKNLVLVRNKSDIKELTLQPDEVLGYTETLELKKGKYTAILKVNILGMEKLKPYKLNFEIK